MIRQKAAVLGFVAALSLGGFGVARSAGTMARPAGAALTTYTNAKTGYSISYPKGWKAAKTATTDLVAQSADNNAFISAVTAVGAASAPAIQAQQKKVLAGLGTGVSKLIYVTKTINSTKFQISEQVVKAPSGKELDIIVMDAVKHGRIYDFGGGVVQKTANENKNNTAVLNALFSIKIK